jgi:predicted O-methyltransferase YrrM
MGARLDEHVYVGMTHRCATYRSAPPSIYYSPAKEDSMGGPMYDSIIRHTQAVDFVKEYLSGGLPGDRFVRLVDEQRTELLDRGMSEWEISLLRRFPVDEQSALSKLFGTLGGASTKGHPSDFAEFRDQISDGFRHLPDRFTSIFPEETRVAYELSRNITPRSVLVAGSYYMFLAVWLIPGLAPGGKMSCVDPDPTVCDLARANMDDLGFSDQVEIICDDAIGVLERSSIPLDLVVIDAYGSREHPDPRFHGKTIYGPIVKAALPRLASGSVILAHNADPTSSDLDEFFDAISGAQASSFLETTEHLAVFRL